MKCTSIEQAISRYGAIDFAAGVWPRQSEWMTMIAIAPGQFPNWKVEDTAHPVQHIYCNKDMAEPLQLALFAVAGRGLGDLLHEYSGCFNIRMVRGSAASPSVHSYGLGIDLNVPENPLGATSGGFFLHPEFVKCFTDQGFAWGGNFHGRKDSQHFSYSWEG